MEPTGTIVFTSVGRPYYGFDLFSLHLPSNLDDSLPDFSSEHRLTDGISINFNGHFVDEGKTLVYISERTGSARIFLNPPGNASPDYSILHPKASSMIVLLSRTTASTSFRLMNRRRSP
ncbi:UNVERIFIED_CONTAM: hypothetical protein Sradi_1430900 [Sesamum radiatum]|uniref:Uncharacterized protein n=1 Tax=Sesamum radiatum TaxID=300843 RepID=A0AAW2USE6_SESRA